MTLIMTARRRGTQGYPLPASALSAPWNSSDTPCVIPTYEGSGATIHPSVVDMGTRWHGYRWWMANTPYPGQNDAHENPEIYGSNDRRTWTVPAGLTNPIDPDPGAPWFHSDTELVWDPETSRLVCLYRLATSSTSPPTIYLRAQSSPDGVTWTDHGTIHTLPGAGARLSPAVECIAEGEWRMWVWGGGVAAQMLTATDPLGPWTVAGSLTLGGASWTAGWHGDVIRYAGTYFAIYSDTSSSGNLWLTSSTDGLAWSARVQVIDGGAGGGWDVTPYRPSLLPSTEAGFFDCWYSAYGGSVPGGCATDYVRLPISLWPTPYTIGTGKTLNLSGTVNLVVDGNSIMTDAYSTVGAFDDSLRLLEPLASGVDTSTSVAISGQTWTDMAANHADVDAAWVEGATNILFLGETRNQIVVDYGNGITDQPTLVTRCQDAITDYLAAVRAVHPGWRVIIGGTLPSGGQDIARYQVENAAFVEVDAWLHANVDTLGLHAVVGYRNHAAFDHDGLTAGAFSAYASFWHETAPRYTHPKDPGKAVMAQNVNDVVTILTGGTP